MTPPAPGPSQHAMNRPTVIAIIPARGGSRGIPRKNLQFLGDRPLIAWSIEAARRCRGLDRVIVSTDDAEIAAVARRSGAEVPFLRPPELARDDALIGDVETHVITRLEAAGTAVAGYLCLYPTHPFRSAAMLDAAVRHVRAGRHFKTVRPVHVGPGQYVARQEDGTLVPLVSLAPGRKLGRFYRPYGLVTAFARGGLLAGCVFYPVSDPVALTDIDTPEDLARARAIVAQGRHVR